MRLPAFNLSRAAAAAAFTALLLLVPAGASARVDDLSRVSCTARWAPVAAPPARRGLDPDWSGIAARAPRDVWAVGSQTNLVHPGPRLPLAGHWDGHTWRSVAVPATNAVLDAVAAAAADDVWAVGSQTIGQGDKAPIRTLVAHWNGDHWAIVRSPNDVNFAVNRLSAVAALSKNNVWAVGSSRDAKSASFPLLLHWNGSRWSETVQRQVGTLDAIVALAPNDIWATGEGENTGVSVSGLIEHWDGRAWTATLRRRNLTDQCSNCYIDLDHVAATARNDVWAAGYDESEESFLEHWNGRNWRSVPHPEFDGGIPTIRGLAAFRRNDAWAAGVSTLQHWNGKTWSRVKQLRNSDVFQAIGGVTSTELWAATSGASFLRRAC